MKKTLTFSFDDGVIQDIRLIELLNKYGMKATFNLNSSLLGLKGSLNIGGKMVSHDKVNIEDVKYIYEGHEVAAHTLTHPNLALMTEKKEIIHQVEEDRMKLSSLCGYEVIGMAYPCGGVNYNAFVSDAIRKHTGIKFARTIVSNRNFSKQENLYEFKPTVYFYVEFEEMFRLGKQFIDLKVEKPQTFYVWGHSYEFDVDDGWKKFEAFLEMMSGREDICYCTNRDALILY